MRIRKNAKLSPLISTCSSSSLLQNGSFPLQNFETHICQLNQSPWDVIPFASSIHQLEEEDIFKNGDSFGAFDESVASMMETEVVDVDNKSAIENFDDNQQCGNKKVVNNSGGSNKGLKRNSNGGGGIEAPRRGRGRPKKSSKGSGSGSNDNEFYYYSGFGPLWGKQRKGEDNKNVMALGTTSDDVSNNNVVASVDYVEDYEDDYDDYDDNGKRRIRKPVKERSLKSLM